jgi:hypothetical protein
MRYASNKNTQQTFDFYILFTSVIFWSSLFIPPAIKNRTIGEMIRNNEKNNRTMEKTIEQ